MKFIPFFALVLLTGCVSQVVPAGPDTYFISYGPLPITMSAAKAKAKCYQQAAAWCTKRGLVMVPVSSAAQDPVVGIAGHAELTFHALKPGDPDIKRANIEAPDTTKRIETR
jgi:hypothetical protein